MEKRNEKNLKINVQMSLKRKLIKKCSDLWKK